MKRLLAVGAVCGMMGLTACSNDGKDDAVSPAPVETARTYVRKGDKVLVGDTAWIEWSAPIAGAGAAIRLSTLNPVDSAYYGLSVLEREDRAVRVVFFNDSLDMRNLPPVHYSRIKITDGVTSAYIDSFQLKELLLTDIIKPHGGDTIMTGDTVALRWRVDKNNIDQLKIKLSTDNGVTFEEMTAGMGLAIDDQPFIWAVGIEPNPVIYADQGNVLLAVWDYNDFYVDLKSFIFHVAE